MCDLGLTAVGANRSRFEKNDHDTVQNRDSVQGSVGSVHEGQSGVGQNQERVRQA